jgi:DNA adenine methylase
MLDRAVGYRRAVIARDSIPERVVLSPLRYPGGKRRLMPYVSAALTENSLELDLFVEPFAGGASVALELVATGKVQSIGLAERDPYVASFWKTVFFDTDWLCRQIEHADVTLDTWERMKRTRFTSTRRQAFACLFLNRTSFNGALHRRAGPIGGKRRASVYTIDCRFPRERLVRRIRTCALYADRVAFVEERSALDLIPHVRRRFRSKRVFYYLDPPFWSKSRDLYRYSFSPGDHARLATALRYVREPYLLSYDPAPEVEQLYVGHKGVRTERVELLYTATQRTAEEELVITNLSCLPRDTRLWRTNREWMQLRRRRGPVRMA